MFHGGDTKFSSTACQWIEAQAMEVGKHIHHKMCKHGGERMVTVWVLNDKGKKKPVSFLVDGYEPETNTMYQFHRCNWHGYKCFKDRQEDNKRDIRIRVRLIGLLKIMDGIQSIILWLLGNVKSQY